MASLQISSRVSTSFLPVQSAVTPVTCSLKVSQVYSAANRDDGNSSVEPALNTLSMQQGNNWARLSGMSRFQENRRCKSSLLKAEAPLDTVPSTRLATSGESAVHSSFETEASIGRVECNNRGCRPIYDNDDRTAVEAEDLEEEFSSLGTRVAVYAARSLTKDLEIRPYISFPLDFAEFLNEVWLEQTHASKYFEIALKKNPNDGKALLQFAQFAWKTLGDLDKADELFARALEELPNDSDAHAMYTLFLWQTDE